MDIFIVSSYAPEVLTFRGDMIRDIKNKGHRIVILAPEDKEESSYIENELGVEYEQIKLNRTGTNPIEDIRTIVELVKLIKKYRPDIVFSYTIKPVIYSNIACRIAGVENCYSMISGLGSISRAMSFKAKIIKKIVDIQYKSSLKQCKKIFFQNKDDRDLFVDKNLISMEKTEIINGSGVNLNRYTYEETIRNNSFIFIGRLIKDKGIIEYCDAARIVKDKYPDSTFRVLGPFDSNPTSIKKTELEKYIRNYDIDYLGVTDDVRNYIKNSMVFVLPSYHEGTSRATLEAMAMGRAILTTDAPGCRETVKDGVNGFLVPVEDSKTLAEKMIYMIENHDEVEQMGIESRRICEEKFDVRKVNEKIIETMGL